MAPLHAVLSPALSDTTFTVRWAKTDKDVLMAQKLRALAFGFCPPGIPEDAIAPECDSFDAFARHLIVTDNRTGRCIGTYRVLDPAGSRKAGGTYAETEFDLSALDSYRDRTLELGRSCVHPEHRQGGVIALLWSALVQTLLAENMSYLMGCASVDLTDPTLDPDRIWTYLQDHVLETSVGPAIPHRPFLCVRRTLPDEAVPALPPLLKGYLRLGARIIGNPSHDPVFQTADFPVWLPVSAINGRYVRHFFRREPGKESPV